MERGHEFVQLSTCLSNDVKELITNVGISECKIDIFGGSEINIDWKKFGFCFTSKDTTNYVLDIPKDKKAYSSLVQCLAPCLKSVNDIYSNFSAYHIQDLGCCLSWTKFQKIFIRCYELLRSPQTVHSILGMLILTAYTERALGNLFLLKGKQVPFLIKDLINSNELKEIVGVYPILGLRIIMGSPLSLNVRNVLWHGFAGYQEVDKRYGYFLLAILASMKIEDSDVLKMEHRTQLSFDNFKADFNITSDNEVNSYSLQKAFVDSPIVYKQMLPYWTESIYLFENGRWGESLILSLPALESCVRVLYGTLNKSQKSILTAENETLYLTFDELFAQNLKSGDPNRLRVLLGDNFLEMFLDLLMYEEGPRVRDRISHGEVNLNDIPKEISLHVLYLGATLGYKASRLTAKEKCQSLDKLLQAASVYEAKYHPSSKLKKQILEILQKLDELGEKVNQKAIPFENESITREICFTGLQAEALTTWSHFEMLRKTRIMTIYSTHRELLLIKATRQITINVLDISNNVIDALIGKEGKLRSRQRSNYQKLLESVSMIKFGLETITLISTSVLVNIKELAIVEGFVEKKLTKFLKKLLQYTQNLKTRTDANKNKWEESCEMISLVINYIKNYFHNTLNAFSCGVK